ncbi:MAG: hypothetical protein ABI772_09805 [Bacteroidota bacterium]
MKRTISKIAACAALALVSISGNAQVNLGAACGCPTPVSSRPTVLLSSLAVSGGATDGDLLTNTILSCDKTYILDKKIFVPSGKQLTIKPGTVIKGRFRSTADSAVALIVSRGGQLIANGEEDCSIVFTAEADQLDGTYPITNIGRWGGVVLLGKATNNLTLAANGPFVAGGGNGKLAVADGLGVVEGFASSNTRDQFGVNLSLGESFDDNDNSGSLKFVSIRHSGAILTVGGEINGLTLGSVGRATTLEHLEIVSSADDGIEFFGGTVNVKYCTQLFGNDDMFDWDLGWSGKAQFLFGLKNNDLTGSPDSDNAFESDADDQKSNNTPRSHPIIYNATFIGNAKTAFSSDNTGPAAIRAKELTEGEIYNSIFANFRYGLNINKALGTRTGTSEAYHNWANVGGNGSNSLKVKCNAFVGMIAADFAIENNGTGTVLSSDTAQFYTTDKNTKLTSITGFDYAFAINNANNNITHQIDVTPNPALSTVGCATAPADGFFTPNSYKGAFDSANGARNWLSDWTYSTVLGTTSGLAACPTDINGDGITNTIDFLQLLGKFNQSCN